MNYTEDQIDYAFECGYLFVKCINNLEDDEGIYAIKGYLYEVVDEITNEDDVECWVITCERDSGVDEIIIPKDDKDFELIITDCN